MGTNFDPNTQYLVFKPEYSVLPISVIKNGVDYMTIYPDQSTQDDMIQYYTTYNLWHLFDIVEITV